jgi:hypothetical protein
MISAVAPATSASAVPTVGGEDAFALTLLPCSWNVAPFPRGRERTDSD